MQGQFLISDTTLLIDRGRLRQTPLRRRMIIDQVIEESSHSQRNMKLIENHQAACCVIGRNK